jgi:hypothetical protein
MRHRLARAVLAAMVLLALVIFATRMAHGAPAHPDLWVQIGVSAARLVALFVGGRLSWACARAMGQGNEARTPWLLIGAWFAAFFAGTLVTSTYTIGFARRAPLPSLADLFFVLGYAALLCALVLFIRAYHASGFDVGSARGHAAVAAGSAAALVTFGAVVLAPIARAPEPLVERLTNLAYPTFDLCVLVPTLVLLRITLRFRGGGVWKVWAALLAAIACMSFSDVVFGFVTSSTGVSLPIPAIDLLEIVTYAMAAFAIVVQADMVAREP